MQNKIFKILTVHLFIFSVFTLLTSTSHAGQVSGWWEGSWKCIIANRPAEMKWVPVSDDSASCNGDNCTINSGAKWKGSFSDNGSKWVPLTNLERENDGDIYFTHADGNRWFLAAPKNNTTTGHTIWNNQEYLLQCKRQRSQDSRRSNTVTASVNDAKFNKSVMQDKNKIRIIQTPSNPSLTNSLQNMSKHTNVTRGFDDKGNPYVEYTFSDGTKHRKGAYEMIVISPDGQSKPAPYQFALANAQASSPPSLPNDPKLGRIWMENHNETLRNIIRNLVNNNDSAMKRFDAAENKTAGDDLFNQISYRTQALKVLVQP